ncbi:MAG: 4-(cytidine 5'-diphospho)-2-C-methyl-D-erythritol kinase [Deltaproteobacteria bacterium]|nr:4-(cytidine 5'-diphospho)-2-C-methyl-D-erythritol kinase [Deltaproteobacteria bacterium]
MKKVIKIRVPAKVNLFLRVTGKRPDGFHDLISLFQPISIYDELTLTLTQLPGVINLDCGSELPSGPENLVYQAAKRFFVAASFATNLESSEFGVDIILNKDIPISAGLGGGSSDAAGVLIGLNELLGRPLSDEKIKELALSIGSDVPFFLLKHSAIVRGRGEIVESKDVYPYSYLLVNPGFAVSASWAYSNLILTKRSENNTLSGLEALSSGSVGAGGALFNDLELAVENEHKIVSEIKEALLDAGAAGAMISGSGPTVFGLFLKKNIRDYAYEKLKNKFMSPLRIFKAEGLA